MTTPYTGNGPDDFGFFGKFGGCYMPESLMPALQELEQAFNIVRHKPEFWAEYQQILTDFVGRPSPLFYAMVRKNNENRDVMNIIHWLMTEEKRESEI